MSGQFDPYHQWLGISPKDQPPDHYRLLGIERFESDPNVIENAADRQMAHVRSFQTGRHAEQSQALLNELARAKVELLNAEKRAAYDATLQSAATAGDEGPDVQPEVAPRAVRSTRAVPQSPAEQPLPQPKPRAHDSREEFAEVQIAVADAAADPARRLVARSTQPPWRQPLVLAAAGGGIALAVVFLVIVAGGNSEGDPVRPAPSDDGAPVRVASADGEPADDAGDTDGSADDSGDTDGGPAVLVEPPVVAPDPSIDEIVPPLPVIPQPAPAPEPAEGTVNLLQRIDLQRDVFGEPWRMEEGALVAPVSANSRIQCAVPLPAEYVVTVTVERLSGQDSLVIGLVHEGHQFMANLDGWDGATGGLQLVDNRYAPENATAFRRRVLTRGEKVTIRCTLHREGVRVQADGDTLVDWRGDAEQLSRSPEWRFTNPRALFLGAARSSFRISRWEVAPLKAEPPQAAAPAAKRAVPESADRAVALQDIRQQFEQQYAGRRPEDKRALAAFLLQNSLTAADESARHYTLLDEARRLAVEGFDLRTRERAVAQLAAAYDVDRWGLEQESLRGLSRSASSLEQRRELVETVQDVVEQAVAAEQFDAAEALAQLALTSATTRDAALRKRAGTRRNEIRQAKRMWEEAQQARAALAETPDDAAAHTALGSYLCFALGRWSEGLPHLAQGDDEKLRMAAEDDIRSTQPPAGAPAAPFDLGADLTGDLWFNAARKGSGLARTAMYFRALHWYRRVLPNTTDRARRRVQEAIEDIERMELIPPGSALHGADGLFGRVTVDRKDVGLLLRYRAGKSFREETLQALLDQLFNKSPDKTVVFSGLVRAIKDSQVLIEHRGGSTTGGVARLYVDGNELGAVGDDLAKDTTYEILLSRGDHQVRWVIQGGLIGNNRLAFVDRETRDPLDVFHSKLHLQAARQLPTLIEAEAASE